MSRKARRTTPVLVGAVALAFLGALCGIHHGGAIERDLAGRAGRELERAAIDGAVAVADGRDLSVDGRVATEEDRRHALDAVAGVQGVRRVRDRLAVGADPAVTVSRPALPSECRERFESLFAELEIGFGTRSAELTAASAPQLDRLAALWVECAGATVEVGGHTDSRSGADFNLILSRERAEAVIAYLVAAGVPADRLQARGYGESAPVADNATAAGRARNRRIEFRIR